jgi:nucleotide-binding universal stress UspA family protein
LASLILGQSNECSHNWMQSRPRMANHEAQMSIDLSSPGGVATLSETERNTSGPLLLATDGSSSSDAAFPAAMLLAERLHAKVEVLSVVEPVPLLPDYPVSAPSAFFGESVNIEPLRRRATEQTRSLGDAAAGWNIDIESGNPVNVISREARELGARMIIIGLNHHDTLDRLLWGDTMLGLVRRSDVPVLAVAPTLKALPRRVVIAVDFSRASAASMRAALMLVDEPATIYLVHVKVGSELPLSEIELWDREYDLALPEAFGQITAGLDIPLGVHVEQVTLRGNASKTLLEFAESVDADLLVAGSHGRGTIGRIVVGSVATHLLRGTSCSVMIIPRAAVPHLTQHSPEPVVDQGPTPIEMSDWSLRLGDFTRRNAARHVILEVDDPEIGSQAEVKDYPFLGIDFDHRTRRVEIMLGDPEPGGRHLTHATSGVTSIDVVEDSDGRDAILRLAHGKGQTLLSFI